MPKNSLASLVFSDNINDVYDNFHKAYFKSWDDGKHMGSGEFVAFNGSGGLFLKNFDKYFSEFKGSFALIPIRNIETYISSDKPVSHKTPALGSCFLSFMYSFVCLYLEKNLTLTILVY